MSPSEESLSQAPAADDPRVLRAVEEYQAARAAGTAPDRGEFLARHADIAAALAECLDGLEFIHQAGPQLQPAEDEAAAAGAPAGTPLGDFRVLREVGRGGMGIVYEAEQLSLGRRVALKVLPFAAALDPKQLQRFQNEARAAAHLHHPNIVPVHAVGCERGVHYYAMQFIEGQTVAAMIAALRCQTGPAVVEEHPLLTHAPAPDRAASTPRPGRGGDTAPSVRSPAFLRTVARLGIQAALALEHAHQLGVVHRDVKPGNLLVDAGGKLWVTDFGLAHVQNHPGLTMTGDLLGTLRYMSPEQALAQRALVDHRTDVYSLGATLYELLTLEPAFPGTDRQEVLRQIAFEEPRPPRRLNRAIPAELETVVLKAMAKAPAERYAAAQELADDLGRFLEDRPIRARRPTLPQRLAKWARRHKPIVWSAAMSALGLLITAVVALAWSNVRITQERNQKTEALNDREAALKEKDAAYREAQAQQKLALQRFYAAQMNLAQQAQEAGQPARVIDLLETQRPRAGEDDLRTFEWYYLWRLCHRGRRLTLKAPVAKVLCVALSPDGKTVAAGGANADVALWDAATGREQAAWKGHGGAVACLAFAPDGKTLAAGVHNAAGATVVLYDTATGQERASLGRLQGNVWSVAFARDGRTLASGGDDGTAKLWDVSTRQERATLAGHASPVICTAFSPDGKTLATGSGWGEHGGTVKLWDLTAEPPRVRFELPSAFSVAFSPDGALLATGGEHNDKRGVLELFEAATGRERAALQGHVGTVYAVAFAPDGKTLASAGNDRTIRLWDPDTQRQRACYAAPGPVYAIALSHDGHVLASAGDQGTINLWDTAPAPEDRVLPNAGACVAFSADGKTLATSGHQATKVWDMATWKVQALPCPAGAPPTDALAVSHDGKTLAVARGPTIRLLDVATRQERPPFEGKTTFWSVAFSLDDRTLASASDWAPAASLWDLSTGQVRAAVLPHATGSARVVAFSPDGTLLAAGSQYGVVKLWDAATGAEGITLDAGEKGGMNWTFAIAFSADGTLLAAGDRQGLVKVWDVNTGALRATLRGHTDAVFAVAFSPDGRTLATGGDDRTVKLWDVATGQERLTLKGHPDAIPTVAFSPDGTLLATGSWDDTVRVWQAATEPEALARMGGG